MKLKSLRIENFKAFGKSPQTIPIKPITLVFGPNSAGKSSFLHSLLWLNHAVSRGETDVYHPTLSGQSINLGGFNSCLNRNSITNHLKYSIEVEDSHLKSKNLEKPRWINSISRFTLTFVVRRPSKDQIPRLTAFKILGDDVELLTAWSRGKEQKGEFSSNINFEHPAMPFGADMGEETRDRLASINSYGGYDLLASDFLPNRFELNYFQKILVDDPERSSEFRKHLSFILQELPSGLVDLFSELGAMIKDIQYLPPLRVIPDRSVDIRACELPGWRWLVKQPALVKRINTTLEQLKFGHRIQLRKLMSLDALEGSLIAATCHAEAGDNWGALSYAVEKARSEWEFFDYVEKRKWLEVHPAFFREMAAYWSDIIRGWDSVYSDEYYEENPDKDINRGDFPPDEWIQQRAEELAWSLLDDWNKDANSTFYADAVRLHISENQEVSSALASALSGKSMKEMVQSNVERVELRLHDPKNGIWTALQDVGVGVSQSLPIILEAFAQREKLIAIEQPELHLHPALQSELGDVFIESALGENKNTFLLETHSEHLLLRIMKRMRQTAEGKLSEGIPPVRPEDVALLFVSPGQDGSVVQDIGLNERGELIKAWPGGFFEEGFNEMFD